MNIYHGCASKNDLARCDDLAPSFQHGVQWLPEKCCAHDRPWILDNGVYGAWANGEEWDPELFVKRLRNLGRMPRDPDWVILPDVREDAEASLQRSEEWADQVAGHGVDYYLPAQDGMSPVRAAEEACRLGAAGVFVGGSDRYTWQYAHAIVEAAHDNGLGAHIGRPGPNLTWARDTGADSVDTTTIVRNGYWDKLRTLEASSQTAQTELVA